MKRYEKYKPSGIEWIGEVPEQWGLVKTKFVCTLNTGNSLNAQQKAFYGEITEDVPSRPYIASKDIDRDTEFIDYDNGIRIPLDELSFEVAPANSTLLCIEGGSAGKKMGFVDREVCYVNKLCCFNSFKINPKYQYYFVKSRPYWEVFSQNIQGMIGGVSVGVLKEIKMPFPAPAEQEAIAAYLDARCGDIDKVVATQEKRIALLNEMKQSIIAQAVTQGLNPDVKMKDSGVEWIGRVPEHWIVKKLRFLGATKNGISKSGESFGKGYPFVSYSDVYKNYSLPNEVEGLVESTEQERKDFSVLEGDVFFTRTSETIEEVGFSSVCMNTIQDAVFAGFVIRFRPTEGVLDNAFSKYYFRCDLHRAFFVKEMNLVTRASLSQELLKALPVLTPPISEQKEIAGYLDQRCGEIDKQIDAVTRQIELLTEYKQALITEVVTGKRKVC